MIVKMELSQNSVKYIILILVFVIIGYILFSLYRDTMYLRSEISKIKTELSEVKKSLEDQEDYEDEEDYEEEDCGFFHPEDSQKCDVILEDLTQESQEELIEDEEQKEIPDDHQVLEIKEDEPLQIQKSVLETIDEEPESDIQVDEKEHEILFLEKMLCPVILKSGKNKGSACNKDTFENTGFCKKHQN